MDEEVRRAREYAFYIGEQANNLDLMLHYYSVGDMDAGMYYHLMILYTHDEVVPTWKDSICYHKLLSWCLHETYE
jgi:hypothetical protein